MCTIIHAYCGKLCQNILLGVYFPGRIKLADVFIRRRKDIIVAHLQLLVVLKCIGELIFSGKFVRISRLYTTLAVHIHHCFDYCEQISTAVVTELVLIINSTVQRSNINDKQLAETVNI